MLYVLFGISFFLLVGLVGAAVYMVLQKKQKLEVAAGQEATIHTSGMFSLVRQSPRTSMEERVLSKEQIKQMLEDAGSNSSSERVEAYLTHWNELIEANINVIEEGDKEGLQTYCYDIPKADQQHCTHLDSNTYVTREQLQNYPAIIPPFYLGCGVKITPKQAWNTNLNGTGWQPMLPVKGKYLTPSRSGLVEIV